MSRLLENYKTNIIEDLKSKLSVSNIHQVPKVSKIVINMGIGDAKDDTKSGRPRCFDRCPPLLS